MLQSITQLTAGCMNYFFLFSQPSIQHAALHQSLSRVIRRTEREHVNSPASGLAIQNASLCLRVPSLRGLSIPPILSGNRQYPTDSWGYLCNLFGFWNKWRQSFDLNLFCERTSFVVKVLPWRVNNYSGNEDNSCLWQSSMSCSVKKSPPFNLLLRQLNILHASQIHLITLSFPWFEVRRHQFGVVHYIALDTFGYKGKLTPIIF